MGTLIYALILAKPCFGERTYNFVDHKLQKLINYTLFMKNIIKNGLHCMCTPLTHHSTGQVGNFLRKDDRTLVI